MTQIPYIREKISEAAGQLLVAVHIKDGLRESGHLMIAANLNTDGLHERVRSELESILHELTKRGNLDNTLHGMRIKRARNLASRIASLEAMADDL